MKILTVGEFMNECHKIHPKEIILHSDNQSFDFGEIGMKFDLRFADIHICLNPDIISLIMGKSRLQLDKIKAIYKQQSSPLGQKFKIQCRGFVDTTKETSYILILQ